MGTHWEQPREPRKQETITLTNLRDPNLRHATIVGKVSEAQVLNTFYTLRGILDIPVLCGWATYTRRFGDLAVISTNPNSSDAGDPDTDTTRATARFTVKLAWERDTLEDGRLGSRHLTPKTVTPTIGGITHPDIPVNTLLDENNTTTIKNLRDELIHTLTAGTKTARDLEVYYHPSAAELKRLTYWES